MQIRKAYHHTAIAATVLATTVAAYAATDNHPENDAAAINSAKISRTQAVTAAENDVSGKAVHADYENTQAGWVYDVEVINGAKALTCVSTP